MTSSEPVSRETTTCCIVGGGPAGIFLGLLLARQGVEVTLLEAHEDFDREFRGDTLHASALENLDQIGLGKAVLDLAHGRLKEARLLSAETEQTVASFDRLKTRFPFVAMVPHD